MFCCPPVQARLTGQAERACSAVADEEEAVTGPVPSKATEIIVKLRLRRLGFDLHPGRLSDCRLSEDQVHVRLVLLRCQPPRAKIKSTRVSKSRQSSCRIMRKPISRIATRSAVACA